MSGRSGRRWSRRAFIAATGGLVVGFSIPLRAQGVGTALPGSLRNAPVIDGWIRVGADDTITVFTGKVEFGQGIKTALIELAARELEVAPERIALVTADTARTPDEGYTAGSQSMQNSGTAIMHAAAQAREILVQLAASRLGVGSEALRLHDGIVRAGDGKSARFGELVTGDTLRVQAKPQSSLRNAARTGPKRVLARIDIPAKVTGGLAYVHDLRLPGMLHARVVRPPTYAARLRTVDASAVERMPKVVKVVRDGSYLAVVAEREYEAVQAMRALNRAATWDIPEAPPTIDPYVALTSLPREDIVIREAQRPVPAAGITATYRRPYQMHGSIGPSCAVAHSTNAGLTVWSHTQGVYPLRGALAEMLRVPPARVRCIHMEGAGCYGHNGADDAAADAALIATALPGRPVRVQWMREQEHAFEPYGSAMLTTVKGGVDANGRISDWDYEVWTGAHSTRPGRAGNLAPAWHLAEPFALPAPRPIPQPEGGGDRNAVPLYAIPGLRVVHHFLPSLPLRVSALRSLGAYMNVFSIESFVDELAALARADPVEFRLRHLDDPRASAVVRSAAQRFDWAGWRASRMRGRGFGFARYKNLGAYCAVAIEVDVDGDSGRIDVVRVASAVDSGEAVSEDGIRNQIEGGIVQSLSWTLYEAVAFSGNRVTSRDWNGYPILRFASVPGRVDVHVIDRPGMPFLGTGEAAQGPTAAALANAVADATGVRFRELPLNRARVAAGVVNRAS